MLSKKNELLSKYKSNPLDHYFSLKAPNAKDDEEGRFFVSADKENSDMTTDSVLNDIFEQALKTLDDPDAITIPETKIPDSDNVNDKSEAKEDVTAVVEKTEA